VNQEERDQFLRQGLLDQACRLFAHLEFIAQSASLCSDPNKADRWRFLLKQLGHCEHRIREIRNVLGDVPFDGNPLKPRR
jgi:hypothetical protein